LENKYEKIRREGDIPIPGVIGMGVKELNARTEDYATHQKDLLAEAEHLARPYQKRLEDIAIMTAQLNVMLEEAKKLHQDTLGIEIARRDLENERLHIMVEESLRLGGMRDGVRAFFLEMQTQAEKASEIVYHA